LVEIGKLFVSRPTDGCTYRWTLRLAFLGRLSRGVNLKHKNCQCQ